MDHELHQAAIRLARCVRCHNYPAAAARTIFVEDLEDECRSIALLGQNWLPLEHCVRRWTQLVRLWKHIHLLNGHPVLYRRSQLFSRSLPALDVHPDHHLLWLCKYAIHRSCVVLRHDALLHISILVSRDHPKWVRQTNTRPEPVTSVRCNGELQNPAIWEP